jgi:diaminopimelate decarboxylase/aspartate kinase
MKFGGRSVSTAENWAKIAGLIRERLAEGVRPVIVHSALVGVSNALIALLDTAVAGGDIAENFAKIRAQHDALAKGLGIDPAVVDHEFARLEQVVSGVKLVGEASPRVHARALATGELAATQLGAAYLQSQGLAVEWHDVRKFLNASTLRDQTERARYTSARCDYSPDAELQARFAAFEGIVITQGFIAHNAQGETVLLGRGGSDTSGAYLAGKLQARRLEIWTDAPGFFSADPKAVPSARLLKTLHYREAQEIASAGGGILHPRSISPVRATGIPLFLKYTAQPDWEGTVISNAPGDDDKPQLKAISHRGNITLLSMESMEMWHQVGFLADAFEVVREHGLSVELISTSESNVTVSIDIGANVTDRAAIDALADDLRKLCRVTVISDCAAVTLVGRRIRTILYELSPVLEIFQEKKIHLVTQAANDLNFTFVVDAGEAYRLVQHLHGLLVDKFAGGVFGPTWEQLTGGAPPAPARVAEKPWWVKKKAQLLEIGAEREATYVYDRESIERSIAALKGLKSVDAVYYAMKANNHTGILQLVHDSGVNFECVSPGEIKRVLELFPDLDRKRILFTPNFAPRAEYEWALGENIWLTLDNLFPLKHWAKSFKGKEVFVRIDTGQGRGHHEHVRTAGVHSKFGVPLFEIDELDELLTRAGARIAGLHAHTGSGVMAPEAWLDTGRELLKLVERFPEVRYLDVGGGLGVPEKTGQAPLDMRALDKALAEIKAGCGNREIWLEPGRYIVAQAGVLLARVTQTKGKGEVQYVGVNSGMNSLIRPALYGAYHDIVNLTRYGKPASDLVTVVGPICETGDRLGSDRQLPPAKENDVLLIANTGAYGSVMSSRYNLREPAGELLI